MKLTFETKQIDAGLQALARRLEMLRLRKSYVKAGFIGSKAHDGNLTNAQLASIHEYGLGNVPARPFIRPAFTEGKDSYMEILREAYEQALRKNDPGAFRKALAKVGQRMAADIKNYVTQGQNLEPLAETTIKRKGSSRPLVDTGQMIRSVEYEVKES